MGAKHSCVTEDNLMEENKPEYGFTTRHYEALMDLQRGDRPTFVHVRHIYKKAPQLISGDPSFNDPLLTESGASFLEAWKARRLSTKCVK